MIPLQVRDNSVLSINDALRQIRDALDQVTPIGALVLYPDGQALPSGWRVADAENGRPDLRAHGIADYVFIVRLG